MLYIVLLIFIIFFVALSIVYKKRLPQKSDPFIISAKDVNQDILLELVKIEKHLYKNGFTRYSIVNLDGPKKNVILFYYYNYVDNIHVFIVYNKGEFIFFIVTRYKNGKVLVSSSDSKYIKKSLKTMFAYNESGLSIDNILKMHKENRKDISYEPIEGKLTNKEILKTYNSISKISG